MCVDTCHTFASGYDLRTADDVASFLTQFNAIIGSQYLKGVHLNDSKCALASKKDRHESIGYGKIGSAGFRAIMNTPQFHGIPMILETPCEDANVWISKYATEIAALYAMEEGALKDTREEEFVFDYQQPSEEERKVKEVEKKEKAQLLKRKRAEKKKRKENGEEDEDEDEDDDEDEEEEESKEQESKSSKSKSKSATLQRQKSSEKR